MTPDNALPAVVNTEKGEQGEWVASDAEPIESARQTHSKRADSRAVGTAADTSAALDLDAIDALCNAATDGPWSYRPWKFDDWGLVRAASGRVVTVGRAGDGDDDHAAHRDRGTDPYGPNAVFVAAARSLVPQLVAEVRALREDAARYRWLKKRYHGADFDYDPASVISISVLTFRLPDDMRVSADLDATLDAARRGAA